MLLLPGFLPALPVDRATRGDLLPAAPVPAAAEGAPRLDDDVADLGGEAVGAAEKPSVRDDAAPIPVPTVTSSR